MCASEILPGPTIIITSEDAKKINSNSIPPFPIMVLTPLIIKIAPSIIIEIIAPDSLLNTPMINKIPGINSANAIGICNSAGSPMFERALVNPGSNLLIP